MKYFEFTFDTHPCTETVNDVLAVLGEAGFESFVEREGGLTLYSAITLQRDIENRAGKFSCAGLRKFLIRLLRPKTKDWNEEWEKNFFQPIVIGDRCVIHSTFHQDVPKAEYDILINPQMAFGTGHHGNDKPDYRRIVG